MYNIYAAVCVCVCDQPNYSMSITIKALVSDCAAVVP